MAAATSIEEWKLLLTYYKLSVSNHIIVPLESHNGRHYSLGAVVRDFAGYEFLLVWDYPQPWTSTDLTRSYFPTVTQQIQLSTSQLQLDDVPATTTGIEDDSASSSSSTPAVAAGVSTSHPFWSVSMSLINFSLKHSINVDGVFIAYNGIYYIPSSWKGEIEGARASRDNITYLRLFGCPQSEATWVIPSYRESTFVKMMSELTEMPLQAHMTDPFALARQATYHRITHSLWSRMIQNRLDQVADCRKLSHELNNTMISLEQLLPRTDPTDPRGIINKLEAAVVNSTMPQQQTEALNCLAQRWVYLREIERCVSMIGDAQRTLKGICAVFNSDTVDSVRSIADAVHASEIARSTKIMHHLR